MIYYLRKKLKKEANTWAGYYTANPARKIFQIKEVRQNETFEEHMWEERASMECRAGLVHPRGSEINEH